MAVPTIAEQQTADTEPLHRQARRALREHDVAKAKQIAHALLVGSGSFDAQDKQAVQSLLNDSSSPDNNNTCNPATDGPPGTNTPPKISRLDAVTAYSVLALTAKDWNEALEYSDLGLEVFHQYDGRDDQQVNNKVIDAVQPILRIMKFGWKKFDPSETEGPCEGEGPCVCGWLGQTCPEAVYIAQGHRASGSFDGAI